MKTFSQFIVETEDAAARLDQRRQNARDRSKSIVSDFKSKSKDNAERMKAKHIEMRQKYAEMQRQQKRARLRRFR